MTAPLPYPITRMPTAFPHHTQLPDPTALAGRRVVVVGDITLDEYLYGRPTRLSREAPIPVLEYLRRETILGGAANPARNIVALGSYASLVAVVGDDEEGDHLRTLLHTAAIDDSGVITITGRMTTRKTRILADASPRLPQQVARLDRLDRSPLASVTEERVIAALAEQIPHADAVICSDYQLGLLTPRVVDAVRDLCRRHGAIFAVDAQGNAHYYHHASLFRCNDAEAAATLGMSTIDDETITGAISRLYHELAARLVIVTRGPAGLALIGDDEPFLQLPAYRVSEVFDTTGAGDTFIAVATLALAAGYRGKIAAALANIAAALVVRRLGNAVVTPTELAAAITTAEV
ncbi:bifunctional heptose 7-phosphate kinase/heptose 1-phosphate adenyltransferase [Chloroflexus aggregans]|uniref:PfkB domain protein n=1 Tax=Chloroflexus aggregans (strain MD-66 / DSM 9485) TaxID=326427 RepID=B8G6T7_CHLAD|nr:bifunctional ADP-heptose synthase [Chloroflexus aggregans]ACL25896.1 PfkB domain protein [Chloroflexus aggregans DSM 9485]